MEKKDAIGYWVAQSGRDIATATDLFVTNHYDWSLFMWHLAIEKILKACIISQDKQPLYIHDLYRLAQEAHIELTPELIAELNEITTFNIEARYDNIKLAFYKKATKEYTTKWISICQAIYQQIEEKI
jgi:HEPN domain-containing protein